MAGLASRLARGGHETTLVTMDRGETSRHEVSDEVHRVGLDVMRQSGSLLASALNLARRVRSLRKEIRRSGPDVVLSFCDTNNIVAVMSTFGLSVPIVISERSDPKSQDLGRLWELLRRWTYPRAAAIVAQTSDAADHLRALTNKRSLAVTYVIPSAVDRPPAALMRDPNNALHRILAVGRFEHEKGFDRLIDGFSRLADKHSNWSLRIVGEGSLRKLLEEQIADLGLTDRVSLPGWTRPIWGELKDATLFVLPSRYEGFPSALLEAMAVGVPSIAVDCPSGPRAIVRDGVDGLLVDVEIPGTSGQTMEVDDFVASRLAAAIERLIQDASLREQLGARAVEVVDRFGWESMFDGYVDVMRKVCGRTHTIARRAV